MRDEYLVIVLEHYGLPVKDGKQQCPFHDDQHASMSVDTRKNLWYCHACGIGGSAVGFVQQKEGVRFREARSIYQEIADRSSSTLLRGSSRQSSSLLPGGTRDKPSNSRTIPAWVRHS